MNSSIALTVLCLAVSITAQLSHNSLLSLFTANEAITPVSFSKFLVDKTQFTVGPTLYTFSGFSVAGNIVLKDATGNHVIVKTPKSVADQNNIQTKPFDNWRDLYGPLYGNSGKIGQPSTQEFEDVVYGPSFADTLMGTKDIKYVGCEKKLDEALSNATSRGVPVKDVIRALLGDKQDQYHISIVGGMIRNCLAGEQDFADIDFAISRSYLSATRVLKDFYRSKNVFIDDGVIQASGVRRDYGMIKVDKTDKDKVDALDVGPMKLGVLSLKKVAVDRGESTNHYVYGLSYDRDSKQRDFRFNSIYLRITTDTSDKNGNFTYTWVDPLEGRNDVASDTLHLNLADKDNWEYDVGGWLRLWRFTAAASKKYTINDANCHTVLGACKQIEKLLTNIDNGAPANFGYDRRSFFLKMRKKLIKDNLSADIRYNALKTMKIDMMNWGYTRCKNAWNLIVTVANDIKTLAVMRQLNYDDTDEAKLFDLIQELRTNAVSYPVNDTLPKLRTDADCAAIVVFGSRGRMAQNTTSSPVSQSLSCFVNGVMKTNNIAPLVVYASSNEAPVDLQEADDENEIQSHEDPEFALFPQFPMFSDFVIEHSQGRVFGHKILIALQPQLYATSSNSSDIVNVLSSLSKLILSHVSSSVHIVDNSESLDQITNRMREYYHNVATFASNLNTLRVDRRRALAANGTSGDTDVSLWNLLSDVQIVAYPRYVSAHRLVLASRTSREFLRLWTSTSPFIKLPFVNDTAAIESLLDVIYTNQNLNPSTNVDNLIQYFGVSNSTIYACSAGNANKISTVIAVVCFVMYWVM